MTEENLTKVQVETSSCDGCFFAAQNECHFMHCIGKDEDLESIFYIFKTNRDKDNRNATKESKHPETIGN